jgi:regulator of replication initiation timing
LYVTEIEALKALASELTDKLKDATAQLKSLLEDNARLENETTELRVVVAKVEYIDTGVHSLDSLAAEQRRSRGTFAAAEATSSGHSKAGEAGRSSLKGHCR